MTKKIAVQFFGHLRSFRDTVESFQKHVIKPNENLGYEIDVFIHTWDKTDHSDVVWHNKGGETRGNELTQEDIDFINETYKPKGLLIENQKNILDNTKNMPKHYIWSISHDKTIKLREEYEKQNSISYDIIVSTRADLMFKRDLIPYGYLKEYEHPENIAGALKGSKLDDNVIFCASNVFMRTNVIDYRSPAEWDLLWFSKNDVENIADAHKILIDYHVHEDVIMYRPWGDSIDLSEGNNTKATMIEKLFYQILYKLSFGSTRKYYKTQYIHLKNNRKISNRRAHYSKDIHI